MEVIANSYYSSDEMVQRFKNKGINDFFRSERELLSLTEMKAISSCLDIGCAAGHFNGLLRSYGFAGTFTGIDIVAENVENARRNYPDACFIHGDALSMPPPGAFDLVNAGSITIGGPGM